MPATTAALSFAPDDPFVVTDVLVDEPRDDEILVRIEAAGICHTDLVNRGAGTPDRPVLLGHEGTGVVESVGAEVTTARPGDRVVLTFRSCGRCPNCTAARPAYCRDALRLNHFGRREDGTARVTAGGAAVLDGFFGQSSLAGYALASADNTVVVGPDVNPVIAGPLGCGFQTGAGAVLNLLNPRAGSALVVFGGGAVGLAGMLAALSADVGTVVVVEPSPQRRALAESLGATAALAPGEHTVNALRETTGGGADHALDTTGRPEVLAAAVSALAVGGSAVAVGLGAGVPHIDLRDLVLRGKTVHGCLEGDSIPATFIPHLLELHARGRLPLERLVTAFPHDQINEALAAQHAGDVVKPVLTW
ncbi:Zn-dependent alcohol dehydrogenase, class III [Mycolicibacterium chubuense NBB4]|uniref:Zn-dependent alcohol dehydrogenase, class III n=1 Tax=Mycolicibacterium chubuense (strain NBB4) TaxID=710421 RepID=I4BCD1_MYCCN|nr:NAD(P)-dependent alcohol dehydrogenase [Mycolicibacterium chubuense]AFM14938.1 Zn-dependent alcohol dehydrogenase, class III [Mycolicibacterium chubuense NBB4]